MRFYAVISPIFRRYSQGEGDPLPSELKRTKPN